MIEEGYEPREIRFTRPQMIWLIMWLEIMVEGRWPPNPKDTGYTQTPDVQRSRSTHASFETPAQIAAEVEVRLKATGTEGKLLVAEIQGGKALEELAPESRRVLDYISGWPRRRTPFRQWLANKNSYKKYIIQSRS